MLLSSGPREEKAGNTSLGTSSFKFMVMDHNIWLLNLQLKQSPMRYSKDTKFSPFVFRSKKIKNTCSCTPSTLQLRASLAKARTPPTEATSMLHLSSAAKFASAPAARSYTNKVIATTLLSLLHQLGFYSTVIHNKHLNKSETGILKTEKTYQDSITTSRTWPFEDKVN